MKLIDISPNVFADTLRLTLNRIYPVRTGITQYTIYVLTDDMSEEFCLSVDRFVPATEAEYHAQRGIRQIENFNL